MVRVQERNEGKQVYAPPYRCILLSPHSIHHVSNCLFTLFYFSHTEETALSLRVPLYTHKDYIDIGDIIKDPISQRNNAPGGSMPTGGVTTEIYLCEDS